MRVALLKEIQWWGLIDATDTTDVQSHKQGMEKGMGRAGSTRSLIQNKWKH